MNSPLACEPIDLTTEGVALAFESPNYRHKTDISELDCNLLAPVSPAYSETHESAERDEDPMIVIHPALAVRSR